MTHCVTDASVSESPLSVLEKTCERLASTASELAAVYRDIQDCTGVGPLQPRKVVLIEIAEGLREHLRLYCIELGVGLPVGVADVIVEPGGIHCGAHITEAEEIAERSIDIAAP